MYFLFGWADYSANGGLNDLMGVYGTEREAMDAWYAHGGIMEFAEIALIEGSTITVIAVYRGGGFDLVNEPATGAFTS